MLLYTLFCALQLLLHMDTICGARSLSALQALAQLRTLKSDSVAEIRKALNKAVPGITYPMFSRIPKTTFSCDDVPQPGFYADIETDCQVYHRCEPPNDYMYSFLCPNQTLFNQILLVCDWWYNVDCSKVKAFYSYSNPRLQHYSGRFLDDEQTTADTIRFGHVDSYDDMGGLHGSENDFQEDFVAELPQLQQSNDSSTSNHTLPASGIPPAVTTNFTSGGDETSVHMNATKPSTTFAGEIQPGHVETNDTSAKKNNNDSLSSADPTEATSLTMTKVPLQLLANQDNHGGPNFFGTSTNDTTESPDFGPAQNSTLPFHIAVDRATTKTVKLSDVTNATINPENTFVTETTSPSPNSTMRPQNTWIPMKFRALQPFHLLKNFNDNI